MTYKGLRQDPRIDLAEAAPLAWPLTIYIEPTNICNMTCEFCPQGLDNYKERAEYSQHISMELYTKLIDEIQSHGGVKSLKLYFFGEPLLHPHIGEILRLADIVSERVEVTTNGTPLTQKVAEQMVDYRTDFLRVSLYGEKEYKPSYPALIHRNIERIRKIRDEKGKTKPYIFIKVFTPEEVGPTTELYREIADEVGCNLMHSIGSDCIPVESLTGNKIACPFPFYTMIVKSNGDVVPCCVAWEKSLVIGNANDQTLEEIWNGEKLFEIQQLHLMGRRSELAACKNCDTLFHAPDSIDKLSSKEYTHRREQKQRNEGRCQACGTIMAYGDHEVTYCPNAQCSV